MRLKRLIKVYIIGTEKHEDGNDHLHVYLELNEKMNSTNPRVFDLVSEDKQSYHPNI